MPLRRMTFGVVSRSVKKRTELGTRKRNTQGITNSIAAVYSGMVRSFRLSPEPKVSPSRLDVFQTLDFHHWPVAVRAEVGSPPGSALGVWLKPKARSRLR